MVDSDTQRAVTMTVEARHRHMAEGDRGSGDRSQAPQAGPQRCAADVQVHQCNWRIKPSGAFSTDGGDFPVIARDLCCTRRSPGAHRYRLNPIRSTGPQPSNPLACPCLLLIHRFQSCLNDVNSRPGSAEKLLSSQPRASSLTARLSPKGFFIILSLRGSLQEQNS